MKRFVVIGILCFWAAAAFIIGVGLAENPKLALSPTPPPPDTIPITLPPPPPAKVPDSKIVANAIQGRFPGAKVIESKFNERGRISVNILYLGKTYQIELNPSGTVTQIQEVLKTPVAPPPPPILAGATSTRVAPPPPVATSVTVLTASIVFTHRSEQDCWIIIANKVYDVTRYLPSHPGGKQLIIPYCGRDATRGFVTKDKTPALPHSDFAQGQLNGLRVGEIGQPLATLVSRTLPSPAFSIGDTIETADTTRVRSAPGSQSSVLGTHLKSVRGTVRGGPTFTDNLWWWNIDYDRSPDGWSSQDLLTFISRPTPTPGTVAADSTPPTASFTSPQGGQIVSGTTNLTLTATDPSGIASVAFYVGNNLAFTDTTAPYSSVLNTTTYDNGLHVISAIVRDRAGNSSTVGITVTVNNQLAVVPPPPPVSPVPPPPVSPVPPPPPGMLPDTLPPSTPTNLVAIVASPSRIDLNWNPSTDNVGVTGYRIYRSSSAGGPHSIIVNSINSTSYADTGLSPGTAYYYVVRAYDAVGAAGNDSGFSLYSSETQATTRTTDVGPTTYTFAQVSTHTTQSNCWLIVRDKVYNVTNYISPNSQHPGGLAVILNYCGKDATVGFTTKDATPPRDHAADGYDTINRYLIGTLTGPLPPPQQDATPPTAPENLMAIAVSSSQIDLRWNASTDNVGVTGYRVMRGSSSGNINSEIATVGGTSFSNISLQPNTTYYYTVRAYDAAGNTSGNSNEASRTTMAETPTDTTPPVRSGGSPSGTLPYGTTQATLSLSTDEVATCRYSNAANTSYSAMGNFTTTGGTSHSTVVTGLTEDTTYTYYVRCMDQYDNPNNNDYVIGFSVAAPPPQTLTVTLTASPNTGNVPLTSVLTATVGGTATGNISYTFYCDRTSTDTSIVLPYDGKYENETAASKTHSCTYPTAGTFTGKVIVQRGTAPAAEARVTITAAATTLTVTITASPSTGNAPLTSLLTATVGGTATGNISYTFYCNRLDTATTITLPYDGKYDNQTAASKTHSCTYQMPGTYTGKVVVSRGTAPNAEARVTITAVDNTPPTTPQNLTATAVSSSQIDLAWGPSTDNVGVVGYYISRATALAGPFTQRYVSTTLTSYSDTGLLAQTTYYYYVEAYDAANRRSPKSNTASATTMAETVTDTAPPVRSNGAPTGTLPTGTTQATLSLSTNEMATCKYSTAINTSYSAMQNMFTTTGGTNHSTLISGLTNGTSYTYYVRCMDQYNNPNNTDYTISFSVAAAAQTLTVTLTASPTTGNVPLTSVLTATVGGTATGNISYTFYCNRLDTATTITLPYDGKYDNETAASKTHSCTYQMPGTYTGKVVVSRGTAPNAEARVTITAVDNTPPSAPTNLSATAISSSQIDLSWSPSTDNVSVTGYRILRSLTSGGQYNEIGTSNATSYSNTGLSAATTYYYVVRAYDAAGNTSQNSNVASATTVAETLTVTLTASPTTGNVPLTSVLTATVGGTATGNISYTFYCNRLDTATTITLPYDGKYDNQTAASKTHSCTYQMPGTYTGKVVVSRGTAPNAEARVTITAVDNTPPSAPTNLSATAISSSQIDLSWSPSTDNVGVVGYRVLRSLTSGGPYIEIGTSNVTSYSNMGLSAVTTYYYYVRAYDAAGNVSTNSNSASATTMQAQGSYTRTQIAAHNSLTDCWIIISNKAYNVTSYIYPNDLHPGKAERIIPYCGTYASAPYRTKDKTPPIAHLPSSDGTLAVYYIGEVTPADLTAPSAPTGLTATASATQCRLSLSWSPASDNIAVAGYNYLRSTSSGGPYTIIGATEGTTPVTTYNDNKLITAGQTYYYVVRAYDGADNTSGNSNQASATAPASPICP